MSSLTNKDKIVGAYVTEWGIYHTGMNVRDVPIDKISMLFYAFMLPQPSASDLALWKANWQFTMVPYDPSIPEGTLTQQDGYAWSINLPQLKELKARKPSLKIIISVFGWSMSFHASTILANATTRRRFVTSAVDLVVKNGFDGLDVDWEYPTVQGIGFNHISPNDPQNFAITLQELRAEFQRVDPNKKYLLTSAMGCNPKVIELYKVIHPYLDYVNTMTYDFAGAWDNGGHHAGLYPNPVSGNDQQWNVSSAVKNTLAIGCAPEKIILGMPMYGRGWSRIVPTDPKLPIYGRNVGTAATTYSGASGEPGLTNWKDIINVVGKNGLTQYYDSTSKAYFAHNTATGETWSYDTPETIALKTQYAMDNKLAGVFFWEIAQDTRDGKNNLLTSAVDVINKAPVDPVDPVDPVEPIFKLGVNLTLTQTSTAGGTGTIAITNSGTDQAKWSFGLVTNNFVMNNLTPFTKVGTIISSQTAIGAGQTVNGVFTYTGTANYTVTSPTSGVTTGLTLIPYVPPSQSKLSVALKSTANWTGNPSGGNGSITITNNSTSTLNNWSFQLTTGDFSITSFWTLTMSGTGTNLTIGPPSYNMSLAPGASITSGFGYIGNSFTTASSTSPNVNITVTPTGGSTGPSTLNFKVNIKSTANWGSGGNGLITITNNSSTPVSNWSFNLKPANFSVQSFWAVGTTGSGTEISVTPPAWNTTIGANSTITSGFGYTGSSAILSASTSTAGVVLTTN